MCIIEIYPKNVLANVNCKLKVCDLGLARELLSMITQQQFIGWIILNIVVIMMFPGKNVAHQLGLITDLLGTPSADTMSRVRNEKARRYLSVMRKNQPVASRGRSIGRTTIDPKSYCSSNNSK